MFPTARSKLSNIFSSHPWVSELAAILPLSALIDFIPGPDKLHVLQLTSHGPLWSWIVTPSMSRLLLGAPEPGPVCFLDGYGKSPSMKCVDGRGGENFYAASPQTLRWCLEASKRMRLRSRHEDMGPAVIVRQPLEVEVVHVTRLYFAKYRGRIASYGDWQDLQASILSRVGWLLLLGGIVCSILLGLYLAVAFLVITPLTGVIISQMHKGGRRAFDFPVNPDHQPGTIERGIVLGTSTHMHDTSWTIFYGDMSLIDAVLLRPLDWKANTPPNCSNNPFWRFILRLLILSQWGCAIAAATTKNFNSYVITFWIIFCIVSHSYIYPPQKATRAWLESTAKCKMQRYLTTISSRRTLLNLVLGLNAKEAFRLTDDDLETLQKREEGFKCLDPLIQAGFNRDEWEEATIGAESIVRLGGHLRTMNVRLGRLDDTAAAEDDMPGPQMTEKVKEAKVKWEHSFGSTVWAGFILEGIDAARMIGEQIRKDIAGVEVTEA